MIKSRRVRWTKHVNLVENPEGKRTLGRRRHRWENMKTDREGTWREGGYGLGS
jgi:hypothetical protein